MKKIRRNEKIRGNNKSKQVKLTKKITNKGK